MSFISLPVLTLLYFFLTIGERIFLEAKDQEDISSFLGAFGYSPSCIADSLAICESNGHSSSVSNILQNFSSEIKKELQEIKTSIDRPLNCADLYAKGDITSGVRTVYPFACCPNRPISVFCDQTTDGGGWTVIQRRVNLPQREDFYRTWLEYTLGFGNLTGEFWLGLNNIHALVDTTMMELRIDLEDFTGDKRWAKYGFFHTGNSASKYILGVGKYSGDAGDSLIKTHNGKMFSTHDADHDVAETNCAVTYRGAWWYASCHNSNLNGFQHEGSTSTPGYGIIWYSYKGNEYSLKETAMMVRPTFKHN